MPISMKVSPIQVNALEITEAQGLDPVRIILQDIAPGQGRIIIECYGEAGCAYWPAMGERKVQEFVASVDPDYLAHRLWPTASKKRFGYLMRLAKGVQEALKNSEEVPA